MQQYPEIFPIHAELLANLVFVPFVEKNALQYLTVPFAEFLKDLADRLLGVFSEHFTQNVGAFRRKIDL
jgi:hypothetical protein